MRVGRWLLLVVLGTFVVPAHSWGSTVQPLHDGWRLQSACKLQAGGDAIATQGFSTEGWLSTTVPSTVLAAQVAAGVFPDPFFGMNMRQIPGESYPVGKNFIRMPMPPDSPYRCGWWYRTEFKAPAAAAGGSRFFLHFDGINYSADVWVNGKKIAGAKQLVGTYRIYDLDVTKELVAGKTNVLAVETFAPDEHGLGVNWMDQAPTPPDKNMGLQGSVNLVSTGAVTVRSRPWPPRTLPMTPLATPKLTIYAELHNATGQSREEQGGRRNRGRSAVQTSCNAQRQ